MKELQHYSNHINNFHLNYEFDVDDKVMTYEKEKYNDNKIINERLLSEAKRKIKGSYKVPYLSRNQTISLRDLNVRVSLEYCDPYTNKLNRYIKNDEMKLTQGPSFIIWGFFDFTKQNKLVFHELLASCKEATANFTINKIYIQNNDKYEHKDDVTLVIDVRVDEDLVPDLYDCRPKTKRYNMIENVEKNLRGREIMVHNII